MLDANVSGITHGDFTCMLRVLSLGFTTRAPHWAFAASMSTAQQALLMVVLVDAHDAAVLH
jgi:hypothetical protein